MKFYHLECNCHDEMGEDQHQNKDWYFTNLKSAYPVVEDLFTTHLDEDGSNDITHLNYYLVDNSDYTSNLSLVEIDLTDEQTLYKQVFHWFSDEPLNIKEILNKIKDFKST